MPRQQHDGTQTGCALFEGGGADVPVGAGQVELLAQVDGDLVGSVRVRIELEVDGARLPVVRLLQPATAATQHYSAGRVIQVKDTMPE